MTFAEKYATLTLQGAERSEGRFYSYSFLTIVR
uniref:Uncharacterized protein n=1 Tax=Klebsiella phage FKP3 TaxID=3231233 RepID=A0AAU8HZZ3_9CAUD